MMVILANPGIRRTVTPPHFLADLYSFKWSAFSFRVPLVSATTVAICLFTGVLTGHPGGGLIAGGGAFTVAFGANQRIADSRLIPMIFAVLAISSATLVGTLAGHKDYWLVIAAGLAAFIYGMLTTRNSGLSWVGQQASIALLVASAFPTGPKLAFLRAGLIAAGGALQTILTSAGLRLLPNLRKDLLAIPLHIFNSVQDRDRELVRRLRRLPQALPCCSDRAALAYSLRLVLTICLATEVYRRLGMQSGYWIPMTALLVQKPVFYETLTRAAARILGTLGGAWICSLLIAHLAPRPVTLAAATTLFALLAFATNPVNYALFTTCVTAYIVFLLSLNAIPAPVIAHRRAWCTIVGGLIALLFHLDALLRHHSGRNIRSERKPYNRGPSREFMDEFRHSFRSMCDVRCRGCAK
ncbi:MAG TPA: FUSC family protein [Terracidiphilus sp.]|nr:FUSC family protein [Terracidiphilus sp.]